MEAMTQLAAVPARAPALRARRPVVLRLHVPGVGNLHASRRAEAIARILGLDVVVLKLLPDVVPQVAMLFPQRHHDEAVTLATHAAREAAALARWQRRRERHGAAMPEVSLGTAALSSALEAVSGTGAQLVVVPPARAWLEGTLNRLALVSGVPVLVARRARRSDHVLAATSLELAQLPVVHQAAALASRLEADLTLVHNAEPLALTAVTWSAEAGVPLPAPYEESVLRARQARLEDAAHRVSSHADVRLTRHFDPLAGILETAAREDADLIVVGAREPGALGARVPERLVAETDRSVLLVPVS